MEYLRIGTDYFKKVSVPLNRKESIDSIVKWKKQEIIQDYGRDYIFKIPKFDGFCNIPDHIDFKSKVGEFYNLYHKIDHVPNQGAWKNTERFLRHIFGDQFLLGLDYLTILYQKPTQTLPILALVSEERETGKSTFLHFLKFIFQKNMTINTNEDFRSRFNSDWSNKLIIAIDEVLLDKREDSERLKNLSTAKTYKTEAKGKDKNELPFYGKIVLCSNNEDNFVLIDSREIRYWVRKIHSLKQPGSSPDPNYLELLKKELPAFLYTLQTRKILTKKASRMWFTEQQIHTDALDRLVKGTTSTLFLEILEILKDILALSDEEELCFGGKDLLDLLRQNGVQSTTRKINNSIRKHLKTEEKNSSYTKYYLSYNAANERYLLPETTRGRHFVFTKQLIEN